MVEDYSFSLYMPISFELKKSNVRVLHSNAIDGFETEKGLEKFSGLSAIERWADRLNVTQEYSAAKRERRKVNG